MNNQRPQIGISACLLGQKVRFDGGHKQDRYLTDYLSQQVDFHPFCPEMELGLGTPRPAIQLREQDKIIQLVVSRDPSQQLGDQMREFAKQRVESFAELDGVIVKKGSPSCGMERVAVVINDDGYKRRDGVGLFTQILRERWPLIPVEEEGRLNDAQLRENFFERVFAYRRWKAIEQPQHNIKALLDFHRRHKLMLMARGPHLYRELGNLVAGVTRHNLLERREQYIQRFMQVMALTTKPGSHVNVMQHIMGYFKQALSAADKQELLSLFEAYRQRQLPLTTPLTLLQHHVRCNNSHYLAEQHYLAPYPLAMLRHS